MLKDCLVPTVVQFLVNAMATARQRPALHCFIHAAQELGLSLTLRPMSQKIEVGAYLRRPAVPVQHSVADLRDAAPYVMHLQAEALQAVLPLGAAAAPAAE